MHLRCLREIVSNVGFRGTEPNFLDLSHSASQTLVFRILHEVVHVDLCRFQESLVCVHLILLTSWFTFIKKPRVNTRLESGLDVAAS